MRVRHAGICVVLALLAPAQGGRRRRPRRARACRRCDLPNATVTSAAAIAAGAFTPPTAVPGRGVPPALARAMAAAPAFCRVALTSKPTADSDIKIEVWLPASGWNGKLQAVGNGGWAGTISYQPLAAAVALGYAAASTDSGHTTPGASFAVGHPEKLVDYAHRSLHEMAVHAKAVTSAYYGDKISGIDLERLLHWRQSRTDPCVDVSRRLRCDRRGRATRRAIARARRPPGAPSIRAPLGRKLHSSREIPGHSSGGAGRVRSEGRRERRHHRESSVMPFRSEGDAVQRRGRPVVSDRRASRDGAALYADVKHPKTGQVLYTPLLQPGSELLWGTLAGPQPFSNASETYKYLVAKDEGWDSLDSTPRLTSRKWTPRRPCSTPRATT